MAQWHEEQDRWSGRGERGERYGEDERRFGGERGEESWRGRGWREEDRQGRGRGGEQGERGDWRGERGEGWREGRGRFTQGQGERGSQERGYYGEPGWQEGGGHGERSRGERWRGEGSEWPGSWTHGGMYGATFGGGRGEYGRRGDYPTFGSSGSEWEGYGRGEARPYYGRSERDYGRSERDYGRYGEEDRGTMERFGDKLKEGMRKLTGRGPKGYRRSDDRIRDDVSERIARSWVNADEVEVKVEKGEVTLTGSVERREDKRTLEDIAEDVFGVDEVHNQIRVRRAEQAGTSMTAGTGTTGTGASMSGQQQAGKGGTQPGQTGRH
jgi:hypothetical protein